MCEVWYALCTNDYFDIIPLKKKKHEKVAHQYYKAIRSRNRQFRTDPWLSGGVEPKKNPTEPLGGLSDMIPRELRPVPWFLKLLEKNRCLWEDCCLGKPFCFLRKLLVPDSSRALLPLIFSPTFVFDTPGVLLVDFNFRSLLSKLFFLRLDRLFLSSCQ